MQVTLAIQKSKEADRVGLFSRGKMAESYVLTATFSLSESEKKIFNDHTLFKNMTFMEYNEIEKFTTRGVLRDKHAVYQKKIISVESIYSSSTYLFKAHSVRRLLELRSLVHEAARRFVDCVKALEKLEASETVNFD